MNYILVITDDATRYRTVYFLKRKSETEDCLKHYAETVKNTTGSYPLE